MPKSSDKDHASVDLEANKRQRLSLTAMETLERILEALEGNSDQESIGRLLDYVELVIQGYTKLARALAPEDEFPDRADRWPGLFQRREESVE